MTLTVVVKLTAIVFVNVTAVLAVAAVLIASVTLTVIETEALIVAIPTVAIVTVIANVMLAATLNAVAAPTEFESAIAIETATALLPRSIYFAAATAMNIALTKKFDLAPSSTNLKQRNLPRDSSY